MLRILSWNSNTGFEKMPSEDESSHVLSCTVPGLSSANLSGKRKRSFAIEKPNMMAIYTEESKPPMPVFQAYPVPSQEHSVPQPTPPHVLLPSSGAQVIVPKDTYGPTAAQVKSKEEAQLATMRQTISSQLSLEILMKHKELRLIDQELAKCQVALEQLRRCTEIPFPALQQPSEQVSMGNGAAVRKGSQKSQAKSPAPWGVTDGPYSRHYAKWLMSDPYFDGGEPEATAPLSASATPAHGRSTRGLFTDFAQMVGKTSRSQRAYHQGLPAGFVEPKQKPTGPMILKRKSDGKMVKLVCPDCARFDFGSAQGFINHCRIGHQRNFASHDAAAEGCGQLLDGDEVPQTQAPATSIEAVQTPVALTPITPVTPSIPFTATNTSMHSLVKSAHLMTKDQLSRPLIQGGYLPKAERKGTQVDAKPMSVQCAQVPNLSAFIDCHGIKMDLQSAVEDATKDFVHEESEPEFEMDIDTPLPDVNGNRRHPMSGGKKASSKSINASGGARKPSFTQSSIPPVSTGFVEHEFADFPSLLPSPTNDSTQAPSLIDDDEEMDAGSPPSSDEHDDSDVHFHVRDDEHPEDTHELRSPEIPSSAGTCTQPAMAPQPSIPAPNTYVRPPSAKGRQYNFIAERPMDNDTGDKKRRRIGGTSK